MKCENCGADIAGHYKSDWFKKRVCEKCIKYDTFRDNDIFVVQLYDEYVQLHVQGIVFCDFNFIYNEFSRYNGYDNFVKKHYKEKYKYVVMRLSASYIGI